MSTSNTLSKGDRKALAIEVQQYRASFPYFKSPEGLTAYEKVGLPYPRTMPDEWYDKFLKVTRNTKKKDYKQYIGDDKHNYQPVRRIQH